MPRRDAGAVAASGSGPTAGAAKRYRNGTHRLVAPEETLERGLPLLAEAGITRVADITGLDVVGIPVVAVYRPASLSLVVSQGKGLSPVDARVSGVMESIEIWAAETDPAQTRLASFADLSGREPALDPASLPTSADDPSLGTATMKWVAGRMLATDEPVWVPGAVVSTDYSLPYERGTESFCVSTNGLASGNCRAEAVVHALCEVIERDADATWRQRPARRRRRTRVDPDSVSDARCRDLLDRYREREVAVGIWNITSDVGVPAFRCEIVETARRGRAPFFAPPSAGTGCHPDRAVALARALCEAAQARLTTIAGAREDVGPVFYDADESRIRAKRRQLAGAGDGAADFTAIRDARHSTFDEDVEWLSARLAAVGADRIAVVDLGRAACRGLSVVRVVVPGLEPHPEHPRYRPGRRALASAASA